MVLYNGSEWSGVRLTDARAIATFPFQRYLGAAKIVISHPNDNVDPNVDGTLMCAVRPGLITEVKRRYHYKLPW